MCVQGPEVWTDHPSPSERLMEFIDEQRNADMMDALADIEADKQEAMRETDPSDWDGVEEISSAERNACDHYNERFVVSVW